MLTERQRLDQRLNEAKIIRRDHETSWRNIAEAILPWRQRWGDRDLEKHLAQSKLINSKPKWALGRFAAGLVAGITNPASKWYRTTTSNDELNQIHRVKEYLRDCEDVLWETFGKSNLYRELASGIYPDLGLIGSGAMLEEDDPKDNIRFFSRGIGEYWIDQDFSGRIDTYFQQRPMTVRQMVQQFGINALSPQAKLAHERGEHGASFQVIHAIVPNKEWTIGKMGPQGMPWASYWYEASWSGPEAGFLRRGGYWEMPVLCPRWDVRGGDVWGRGPGWDVVGDAKALQCMETAKIKAIDKIIDPPMKAYGIAGRASLIPGDITSFANASGSSFEPALVIHPNTVAVAQASIIDYESRIEQGFFVDLWMAILSDQRAQRPTATEVEAKRGEVMLQLGPLLQSLNHDMLDPMITRTVGILQRRGKMPEPPPEMVDYEMNHPDGSAGAVRVEFISILHQAQKMTGITGMRELIAAVQMLAQAGKPAALDKINEDAYVDEMTDMLGVKPELIYSDDQVAEIRGQKAQMEQANQQGQAMLAATEGVRNLSSVDPQRMQDLATMVSPIAGASAGLQ